jgi:quercetin dioxygenase-like cupin family protein
MKTAQLLDNLEFHDEHPYAQPLFVAETGRVLRFLLKPGQSIHEHDVPSSPFFVVVLKGKGLFAGDDGQEQQFGAGSLLIFEPGESHSARAQDEELVFVGFLHSVPGTRPGRVSGEIAR